MSSLTVLVPALNRPRNVEPLIRSLNLSVAQERREGWEIDVLFICSTDDKAEIAAVNAQGCDYLLATTSRDRSQYPRKINAGARGTQTEWLFLGADDLEFHWGWLRAAIDAHIETGSLVIGTQDLGNQLVRVGRHSTHSLVHRDYLTLGTIDEPGKFLHEGYDHNACDVEFVETAMFRNQFTFADKAIVEHMHPLWHRLKVKRDPVYDKGMQRAAFDRMLLRRRRPLWNQPGVDPKTPGKRMKHATVGGIIRPRRVRITPRWPKQ